MGRRPQLSVFGSDWDTEDGTGDVFYIFNCFGICVQFFSSKKKLDICIWDRIFYVMLLCIFIISSCWSESFAGCRDYIHVMDLAAGHTAAVKALFRIFVLFIFVHFFAFLAKSNLQKIYICRWSGSWAHNLVVHMCTTLAQVVWQSNKMRQKEIVTIYFKTQNQAIQIDCKAIWSSYLWSSWS